MIFIFSESNNQKEKLADFTFPLLIFFFMEMSVWMK